MVVDTGLATEGWGAVSFRGAERTEAGATSFARPATACVERDWGTAVALVDARTAGDRELLRVTGGALRALLAGALLKPAVTDGWEGASAAGPGVGSAGGVRTGSRVSGSR